MATIKAGTYRFNDVLTEPSGSLEQSISFSVANVEYEVTQEIADQFAQLGFIVPVGSVTVSGSFGGIWSVDPNVFDYFLVKYTGGVFRADDDRYNVVVQAFLNDGDKEVYNTNEFYWDVGSVPNPQTITISNDTEVSAEFLEWFTANAEPIIPAATITYNGSTIASLLHGQSATLKCAGKKMEGDVVVEVAEQTESGGLAINGIIKQYKVNAGATVNAGDFVEFVNKCGDGVFHNGSTSGLSACKLDNSRVFVAYTSNANSSYGTAVVLHIDGDTITVGAKKVFNSSATAYCSVAALTDGKVLVAYYHNTSNPRGHARILTIDGTTIASVGSAFAFWDDDVESVSVIALSESKALVAYMYHVYTGSRGGRVTVLNISGTSISSGAEKSFYSASGSISLSGISLTKLTEGSALLRYYLSSKYYVYVLAIDETAISIGSSLSYTYGVYVTALSETTALAVFNDSTSGYFTASILSISGLSISRTNTMLRDGSLSVTNVAALSENKALVTFNDGSMMVLSIGGTTVSEAATAVFTDATSRSSINIVPFSASSAFIAFVGDGLGMYASLSIDGDTINAADASGTFVQPATGRLHNVGIAATGGAEGDTVDVYMSGIPRSEIVYDYCCTFSAKETTAGTALTSSVNCAVGDLVVAAIATRDTLTLSDGWTLISTSDVNSTDTDTNGHRLSWAYKFAESTTESITVTQASEQRLYINMVALQGATGVTDNGYFYADDAASTRITVTKPEGLVLWGMTAPLWGSTAWTASNNMPIIQLGSGTQQRLGIGLDQSDETSVTIVPSSATPLTVGCLRVQGMDKFYTASTHTWLE